MQDAGSDIEADGGLRSAASAAVPEAPKRTSRDYGSEFWMMSLPSLPGEGALTADPYSRVGVKMERNESTPPLKLPL